MQNLCCRLLRNVVQVGSQQFGSLDVVTLVKLLVDRVSGIGRAAHGKKQDVLASGLLEGQGDGDTV